MQTPKRWIVIETDDTQVRSLADALGVAPILARLLWRRGIQTVEEAQRFLYPGWNGFYDPFLMKDMDKTVARIRSAIDNQERVMIYGDYDADGATSTSLLFLALRELGADVEYYIPDRFSEGYGLNNQAIEEAKEQGYQLVITVDNGISAVEQVQLARELGLDLIVTDHHTPPEVLPDAYAILNPKQPGCTYPDKMLAGVGVAFKLVQALYGRLPDEFLDLAALGTVADLAPLVDENRLITMYGLEKMNESPRPGIRALINVAALQDKKITAGHIGFSFGPRINASGRLDSATYAVRLLTTEDAQEAGELAQFLEDRNKERQEIGEQIFEQAVSLVEAHPEWLDGRVLVVASHGWNEGVIGIVASRLVERYYRPTLMIALGEEKGKASARSIAGFDLYEALTNCADLLGHYGGHKMAAGFSIAPERVDDLRKRINEIAFEVLTEDEMRPKLDIDAELSLQEIDLQLVEQMQMLAPYGFGNPSPRFSFTGLGIEQTRVVGKDAAHLQLRVRQANRQLDCIAFRRGEEQHLMENLSSIDIAGELSINEWNGRRNLQFVLGDWRANDVQVFDKRFCGDKAVWLETNKEQLTVLCFQESSIVEIEKRLFGYPWNEGKYRVYLVDEVGSWQHRVGEDEPTDHVVLYDLPNSLEQFEACLQALVPTQKLYLIQGQADQGLLQLTANRWLPDRQLFAFVYRLLREMGSATREQLLTRLAGNASEEGLTHILQVFCELSFANQEGSTYYVVQGVAKRDLADAEHYKQQQQRVERLRVIGDHFLAASFDKLREWLVSLLMRQA
ncbi:MAG: single-stranded-DNA-specific exonuclease RecJ [Tumebacillaceae bacterium]